MTYGDFMKAKREALGMTQAAVAARMDGVPGMRQAHISDFEKHKTIPNRVQEDLLAEVLGMTVDERAHWHELIRIAEQKVMARKSEVAQQMHARRASDGEAA
jgi:transcriptional regulator with XRE-family HTH domain